MGKEQDEYEETDTGPVQISIETPKGRLDLDGISHGEATQGPDGEPAEGPLEGSPVETGVVPRDDAGVPPPGMDPDTYLIDRELAPVTDAEEKYPGWRVGFPRKLGAFVELIRPFTLLAPLLGGIAASLMALVKQDFEGFSWATLIYGVATLMLLNAASNCMNAAYDAHIDRINKPYRPIPKGLVTRDEASSLAFVLYFFALFRAILISVEFFILVFLIMFITLYYSMPPVRFKKRFWISNVSIAFARGLLGFVAAWTIFGDPSDPTPWVIGGILFIFLVGATTSKDFTDLEGDARFGMRTLPVVYGPQRAALIAGPFFILPFVLIPVGVLRGHLIDAANYLLFLVAWGIYVMVLLQSHATEQDPNFENSPAWKHMYLMLFALYLGFAAVYVGDYYLAG